MATATRAEDFVDSIGVNTHLGDSGLPSANATWTANDLDYLGIDNIRDNATVNTDQGTINWLMGQYETVAATVNGLKLDFVFTPSNYVQTIANYKTQLDDLQKADPGIVAYAEGPNEVDVNSNYKYGGLTGNAAGNQAQKDLYNYIYGTDPYASGVKVFVRPLAFQSNAGTAANLGPWADYGNIHDYYFSQYQTPVYQWMQSWISSEGTVTASAPVVSTESGWTTSVQDVGNQSYVTDNLSKGILDTEVLLDHWKSGVTHQYLYDLISDSGGGFGLFDSNNNPTAAAVDIRNLTSLLSDTGSNATTFSTGSLNYTLSGMPSAGQSMLMESSAGTYDVVLWNEAQIWNGSTQQEVSVPISNVTLNLGQVYGTVKVFDPIQGTTAIDTYSNVGSIVVGLGKDPLVVEISNPGTSGALTGTIDLTNATAGVNIGNTATIATFYDPNTSDTASDFTAAINFNTHGTTTSVGTIVGGNGTFYVEHQHAYASEQPSVPISVDVTRIGDGSTLDLSGTVVVSAPNDSVIWNGQTSDIIDQSGNTWSLTNGVVQENGSNAGFSESVTQIGFINGTLWQENSNNLWWDWNGSTWAPTNGQSASPFSESITNSVITNNSLQALVDASGNEWNVNSGLVLQNGAAVAGATNVVEAAYVNHTLWQENSQSNWASWTGSSWQAGSNPLP